MRKVAKNYGRIWKSNLNAIDEGGISFENLIKNLNPNLELEKSGFNLLKQLLDPISNTRISAEEALNHPFFH